MIVYSPCGMNCRDCEAYVATQSMDMEVLTRHQTSFREQFGKEIAIAELLCDGCGSNGRRISFCEQCEIRACAVAKGYINCAECAEIPCAKGSFIWQEGSVSLQNLNSLR